MAQGGIEALEARLRARLAPGAPGLPGEAAQARMAPRPRRTAGNNEPLTDAAVLILLYPARGGPSLVLTRRTDTVASHRSQVSLPGGRRENGETAEEAALRECREEVAVDPALVAVAGRLSPLEVPVSGYRIQPIVAFARGRPDFRPDPREVAEIIEVGLSDLPSLIREETWTVQGLPRQVPLFLVEGHRVWGATAMILSELLAVIQEMGWSRPPG